MTDIYNLKEKTDQELYEWISGWKPSTTKHIAGMQELKKRNEYSNKLRSWAAIILSALSLILSVYVVYID